jgi:hypothetical protein
VPPTRASEAVLPVTAQSTTPGVTLRYTLDGSRPTEASPAMPTAGATPAATANSAITAAAYLIGSSAEAEKVICGIIYAWL